MEGEIYMKSFLTLSAMLLIGTALFAQVDEVMIGRTYIVKSPDGSGEVPLHLIGSLNPSLSVPDGTEFYVTEAYGNRDMFVVKYEGTAYEIDKKYFAEETAKSRAEREQSRSRSRTSNIINWLLVGVAAAGFVLMTRRNKKRVANAYVKYYAEKRREFPWLDNCIKEHYDPSDSMAGSDAGGKTVAMVIAFVVIVFIASFFFSRNLVAEAILVGGFFAAWEFLARRSTPDCSAYGSGDLTLECPSCHCPHAWGMVFEQNIVEGKSVSKTRTETTRTNQLGWETTEEKETKDVTYSGRVIREYKCDNCGHTYHGEDGEAWDNEPSQEGECYNPPKYAYTW
jgi:hypothetical protein